MQTTLTIAWIFFLAIGSYGQTLTDLQKSKIERQVDSVFQTMVKAAEDMDYDKISTGVDDRYLAGFIVNGAWFTQYDAMIILLKENIRGGAKQSITLQHKKITVLSDRIVLVGASGDSNVVLANGQSFTGKFLWSFVYEKINKDWKVIQSHQSRGN